MPPKRGPPGGRARASAPKSARHVPPPSPTEADRLAKDQLRAAAAVGRSTVLPPLGALAARLPSPAGPVGLVPSQYRAGASLAPRGPRSVARPGVTPVACMPAGPAGTALASQSNLSSSFLQQPDFYLRGAATRMAAYQAPGPAWNGNARGTSQGLPGGIAGPSMAPDMMSQPVPFPRPATPPAVPMTPTPPSDIVPPPQSLPRPVTPPPSGATLSSSLPPPGPGPVEYATGQTLPLPEGRAALPAPAIVAPRWSVASLGASTGQGIGIETQYFNVDGTGPPDEGSPPSGPPAPVPDLASPADTGAKPNGPVPRARSTQGVRRRAIVAAPPVPAGAAGSTGNTCSPSPRAPSRRAAGPSRTTRIADGGGAVSSGPPVPSPAPSATQTRRDPSTPGSTINTMGDTPSTDNNGAAKAAPVRALTATITNMGARLDKLEGAVCDTGRRLQTQGAAFESLAKVVSALRTTIIDGFDSMKALRAESTGPANKTSSGDVSGASSGVLPSDRGIVTGRAVRGATPGFSVNSPVASMRDVAAIRQLMNEYLMGTMAWATCNADVYFSGEQCFELMMDKTMEHRKDDATEAENWLMKPFVKPVPAKSRKGKDRVDKVKPFVPLGQVLPHLIEALKKRGATAYFKAIGQSLEKLTAAVALQWYNDDEYTKSLAGQKAMKVAMTANYPYLGSASRIEKGANDGDESTIRCTSGFYALMSSFVRQHLEALIYASQRKPAYVDLSCYASWRVELFRVDGFLKRHKQPHNNMVLLDGDDPKRTNPTGDKDDMYKKIYDAQVAAAKAASASEDDAEAEDAEGAAVTEAVEDEYGGEQ